MFSLGVFLSCCGLSEIIAVLFLLGTNIEDSMRQKKIFAFYLLYTLFTFNNHVELDSSSMWQTHCIFFLKNIALMQLLSFPPRHLASVFPFDLTSKTSGELWKYRSWVHRPRVRLWSLLFTKLSQWIWWSARFGIHSSKAWPSLVVQLVKNPPAIQETLVQLLGQEGPLEKG